MRAGLLKKAPFFFIFSLLLPLHIQAENLFFADFRNISQVEFGLALEDKLDLKGTYTKKNNYLEITAVLQNINLAEFTEYSFLKTLHITGGEINLKRNLLTLSKGELIYKETPFKIKGTLEGFSSPLINLDITKNSFSLKAKAKYNDKVIEISELILKGRNTKILSSAIVNVKSAPLAKIEGEGHFDLVDILEIINIFGLPYPNITKLKPRGRCNIKFIAQGGRSLKEWETKLRIFSKELNIYGIESRNVEINLAKNKDELIISPVFAKVSKGRVDFRTTINLLTNKGLSTLIINDIAIEQLIKELNLKKKKVSGKLSVQAQMETGFPFSWNTVSGEGKFSIKEGNIWQINFLKGLGEFLFIPEFEGIIFREGYSDFSLEKKNISFENIQLTSDRMTLAGEGKISFKGELDFLLFPEFNNALISASEGLKKYITAFLGESGLAIRITGNIKKPKYKIKSLILSPLNKIKSLFEELIKPH